MHRHIFMSLLKSIIFSDIMQVVSSYNNCPLHLRLGDCACQDTPSDTDVAGEGTFPVNVVAFLCLE